MRFNPLLAFRYTASLGYTHIALTIEGFQFLMAFRRFRNVDVLAYGLTELMPFQSFFSLSLLF